MRETGERPGEFVRGGLIGGRHRTGTSRRYQIPPPNEHQGCTGAIAAETTGRIEKLLKELTVGRRLEAGTQSDFLGPEPQHLDNRVGGE